MAFLNPWLVLGVLGAGVPVVIHLLNRFRPKLVQWAAMELLRRAMLAKSRQIRVEDIILLVLRTLAIVLAALALARPTITAAGGKWLGTRPGVVLALDASFSMMHQGGAAARFDHARERAREILRTLEPGDPATLMLIAGRPRVLLRNVGYNQETFERALRDAGPVPESLNLEACLDDAAGLVAEMKSSARECYVVTDAQANQWRDLGEKARASLRELADAATLFIVPVDAAQAENLAVTRLEYASGALRAGSLARYVVQVSNTGTIERTNVAVRLEVNGTTVDQRTVGRIAPGESAALPMFAQFDKPGCAGIAAAIGSDELDADNRRYAVADVRERVDVLCVDGGGVVRARGDSETAFLATALVPQSGAAVKPSLRVEVMPYLEFDPKLALRQHGIVMLANVPDLPERSAAAMREFVQRGGSLVIFLGDRVSPQLANARLNSDGAPLLPGALAAPVGELRPDAKGWPIVVADAAHPLARTLSALPKELLAEARVFRYVKVKPESDARVILRCGDAGDPLLLEKSIGRGKVLLLATSANRAWNDLAVNPVYPILLQDMTTYLTRQPWEQAVTVGSPVVLPLAADQPGQSAVIRDPDGRPTTVQVARREGQPVAELPAAAKPGFYELHGGGAGAVRVAANVDARESQAAGLNSRELGVALRGTRARVLENDASAEAAIRESRVGTELWRYLLLAALALFVTESLLARRFSRRMISGPAGAGATAMLRREAG